MTPSVTRVARLAALAKPSVDRTVPTAHGFAQAAASPMRLRSLKLRGSLRGSWTRVETLQP
jgi:hypothetical protein